MQVLLVLKSSGLGVTPQNPQEPPGLNGTLGSKLFHKGGDMDALRLRAHKNLQPVLITKQMSMTMWQKERLLLQTSNSTASHARRPLTSFEVSFDSMLKSRDFRFASVPWEFRWGVVVC